MIIGTHAHQYGGVMKKLIASAVMGLALVAAGPVVAGTYQGVAQRVGGSWLVSWSNVTPACELISLHPYTIKQNVAVVDGVSITLAVSSVGRGDTINAIQYQDSPNGTFTSLTIDGQSSIHCDGHTFLLPGYVAPAAVPTMSEWAMILLGVVLAGGAALFIQRRRQSHGA